MRNSEKFTRRPIFIYVCIRLDIVTIKIVEMVLEDKMHDGGPSLYKAFWVLRQLTTVSECDRVISLCSNLLTKNPEIDSACLKRIQ